jgi:hypothetical protein
VCFHGSDFAARDGPLHPRIRRGSGKFPRKACHRAWSVVQTDFFPSSASVAVWCGSFTSPNKSC